MAEHSPSEPIELLARFATADASQAERLRSQLVDDCVMPVIRRVVRARLRGHEDVDDVCNDALVRLLPRLEAMRDDPHGEPIVDLEAYSGVVAAHACAAWLRARFPLRTRLRNRLRYVFDSRPELAIWKDGSGMVRCGLAGWESKPASKQPGPFEQFDHVADGADPTRALVKALTRAGAPVLFDEIVEAAATSWGIRDQRPARSGNEAESTMAERLPDPRPDAASMFEHRTYLGRLWREIADLPHRQRVALLLNLRDRNGNGVVGLLPITGTATIRQIAAIVDMPAERFAKLWNELPLDDNGIAGLLGVTRQQVINLRKSARDRIARRMRTA